VKTVLLDKIASVTRACGLKREVRVSAEIPCEEGVVVAVGRKYFTVKTGHWEDKFHLEAENGVHRQQWPDTKGGSPGHVKTFEQVAAAERRQAVVARLRERGVVPGGFSDFKLSTHTLEAIADLAEADL
jgi:hypothetical protein